MKVVKYSTHLYAIQNTADGSYVQEYDTYTRQLETMVFTTIANAKAWIASGERTVVAG